MLPSVRPPVSVAAEQVDPDRVEAVRLTTGEEQLRVFLSKVHHQGLRRFAGNQERDAVLIDEVAPAIGRFQRESRAGPADLLVRRSFVRIRRAKR